MKYEIQNYNTIFNYRIGSINIVINYKTIMFNAKNSVSLFKIIPLDFDMF